MQPMGAVDSGHSVYFIRKGAKAIPKRDCQSLKRERERERGRENIESTKEKEKWKGKKDMLYLTFEICNM